MRNFVTAILCLTLVGVASAQTGSTAPKSTATKPAATKPAVPAVSNAPVQAVFETTLGNITCTLFPDKAPVTVDNFIGLATGKKDWKNPADRKSVV